MKWIEQVRETLKLLGEELDLLHEFLDGFPFYWTDSSDKEAKALCERATVAYKNALAAIPDEDPMVKLLKWLDGKRGLYMAADPEIERAAIFIDTVELYIEEELGYKLEDE